MKVARALACERGFMVEGKVIQVAGPAVDVEFPEGQIPVIRTAVDTRPVRDALDRLSEQLTTDQISELAIEVNRDHQAPATAARRWLVRHRLI